jgi:hypothetical protein
MYKYRENTVDAELDLVPDPMSFPYGKYPAFGVPKTSYDCKAEVESG